MSVNFIINQIKEKWNNLTRGVSVKIKGHLYLIDAMVEIVKRRQDVLL